MIIEFGLRKDTIVKNMVLPLCTLWPPKEMLNGKYPEAESMEISVEFPIDNIEARYATVMFSPTKYDEEVGGYTDYDWFDVSLPFEEVEVLIDLAKKSKLF